MSELSSFDPSDFLAMYVNCSTVDPLGKVDYLDVFPQLKMYPEFNADLDGEYRRNQIIAYICYNFDLASPIRKKYPSIEERRFFSLQAAKFKVNKYGEFGSKVDFFVKGNVPEINDMIVTYVRLAASTEFSLLVTLETLFYNMLQKVLQGATDVKSSEISNIKNMLIDAQKSVLADENGKELVHALYKKISNKVIDWSPEVVAQKIKEKGVEKVFEDDED